MIIKWNPANLYGMTEVEAIPGVYDASLPVSSFLMNANPRESAMDKVAVASVLVFGDFVAGPLVFPEPVSPMVAEAIAKFLSPISIFVEPVNFEPKAIVSGPNVFSLSSKKHLSTQKMRVIEVKQPPIEDGFGTSFFENKLTVSTNTRHFSLWSEDAPSSRLSFSKEELASLVLLSDDYGVGYIDLPQPVDPLLVGLLKACGISVITLG